MTADEMSRFITERFAGVDVVVNADNSFYFYNPDPNVEPDHMFPFVTLMVNDVNDDYSDLDRPGAYRLNIGVSKETFQSLFGELRGASARDSAKRGDFDYTAPDQLMPHPVYGMMYWLCVVNPGEATFEEQVLPLLEEAYGMAVRKKSG
ncbi:MAG: hypothetical protein GX579_02620 [Chloroflexi bacterium]|jgi:hypothetical protein|nr:hypothetical protein [Chloroflexota bacterium]